MSVEPSGRRALFDSESPKRYESAKHFAGPTPRNNGAGYCSRHAPRVAASIGAGAFEPRHEAETTCAVALQSAA